jgi:hypothetical protein
MWTYPREIRQIALCLLTLVIPAIGSGQAKKSVVVVGVADMVTGAPLTDARVTVSDVPKTALTDWIGEVRVTGVSPGKHRIEVRQLGYDPAEATVLVQGDSVGVVFRLIRLSQNLDTVRINGTLIPSYLEEFDKRRRLGLGRYLTSLQLDSVRTEALADVTVWRFPGLRAQWDASHTKVRIASTHGPTSLKHACVPQIYIDGFFRENAEDDLGSLAAGDVAGIEYYSVAPPVQYSRAGSGCGAILIWTRRY